MNILLIRPPEVAALAFGGTERLNPSLIDEAAILAAQQKFLYPVVGAALYDALGQGRYPALMETYVRPALALWVRWLILPQLAAQAGSAGVVGCTAPGLEPVSTRALGDLRMSARSQAAALMHVLVEELEADAKRYPEYDPAKNILNRITLDGNLVLPTR